MSSPSLEELQRAMASTVLESPADFPLHWITTPIGIDPLRRLGVYANAYLARINESIKESFPALANILGDTGLASLVERYMAQLLTPSRNLNYIGHELPGYLAGDPFSIELPFLSDLARLEWAVLACFHASALDPIDLRSHCDWDVAHWERARFGFQSGTQVIRSRWPIRQLRETRHLDRDEIDLDLDPGDGESRVLVYRLDFDVITKPIDELEAHAFEGLEAGGTLAEAMERFESAGAEPDRVSEIFAGWVFLGLVVECDFLETR